MQSSMRIERQHLLAQRARSRTGSWLTAGPKGLTAGPKGWQLAHKG